MSIPIAVLSHGLLGGGTAPSAYDVRYGVDNGEGVSGTLTSPSTGDVRLDVQYGGDGTQYTGTLTVSCPVPEVAETWTEDMGGVFTDLVAEFGDVLVYEGFQIQCVKTPLEVEFEMQVSGSNRLLDTQIDVRRADAIGIGLYLPEWKDNPPVKRPVVLVSGVQFQVQKWNDDITADPTIKLLCTKLQ